MGVAGGNGSLPVASISNKPNLNQTRQHGFPLEIFRMHVLKEECNAFVSDVIVLAMGGFREVYVIAGKCSVGIPVHGEWCKQFVFIVGAY